MTRPIDDLFGELSRPLGPTDWPEPAQLRRKAEHKRTVRRVTVASSVAVVAAFAVAVPATLAGHRAASTGPASTAGIQVPGVTHQPHPSATASRAPSPDTSTPTSAAIPAVSPTRADSPAPGVTRKSPLLPGEKAPTGTRHSYGSISVVVPEGWKETSEPVYGYAQPTTKVCIQRPASPTQRTLDSCAGLEIWYGGFLPGAYGTSFVGNRETSPAWWHGKDQPRCPGVGNTPGPLAKSPGGYDVWDFYWLGDRAKSATHQSWTVSCADGTTFQPQVWYLPKSQYLFLSYLSDPTAQAILATVE